MTCIHSAEDCQCAHCRRELESAIERERGAQAQLAEAEAGAAAMREALELQARANQDAHLVIRDNLRGQFKPDLDLLAAAQDATYGALSSTAGSELLAQMAAMREALEWCADEFVEPSDHHRDDCPIDNGCEDCQNNARINRALASTAGRDFEARIRVEEREKICQFILGGRFLHDEAPAAQFAREVVAGIRREFKPQPLTNGDE